MGIPNDWIEVEEWLTNDTFPDYDKEEKTHVYTLKNTCLTKLDSYEKDPENTFWDLFPKRNIPEKAETQVNIVSLEALVRKYSPEMGRAEKTPQDVCKLNFPK